MVYRPGIDLSGEESLSACTLFTRHRIERYAAGGRDGFINVLMQGLGRASTPTGRRRRNRRRAVAAQPSRGASGRASASSACARARRRQPSRSPDIDRAARGERAPACRCRGLGGDRDGPGAELFRRPRQRWTSSRGPSSASKARSARSNARRCREGGRMPPVDPARPDGPPEARAIHLARTYRRPARGNGLREVLRRQPRRGMGYRPQHRRRRSTASCSRTTVARGRSQTSSSAVRATSLPSARAAPPGRAPI